MARTLEELFGYLDSLEGRANLHELMGKVAELRITSEHFAHYIRFSSRQYARNLVRRGPWYFALVLCWRSGQRSPIHDHAGSACCVRVLEGILTETRFSFVPNGLVRAEGSQDYPPGSVLGSQDRDLHQVSNLQADAKDLVTLHIYSPPLEVMGTYSIVDLTRGSEPMLMEFTDAAGI